MYEPVNRHQIADAVIHLRNLFRQSRPKDEQAARLRERRDILVRHFLSNLSRTREHPTLNTLLEIADAFSLTLDGAHRLFGYKTSMLRELDSTLNGAYTRIIESYPFERDIEVDAPAHIRSEALKRDAFLDDLITEWRPSVPIGTLEGSNWKQKGTFYIQIGTENSLGSSLPPRAIALVEPVPEEERRRPNPRTVYCLQFGNGYRCSRCVVTRNRLILLSSEQSYAPPRDFAFPTQVRIAGRIRMFALGLPLPEHLPLSDLPRSNRRAPLILPWEHPSLGSLFAAEHLRFPRSAEEYSRVRESLRSIFGNDFSSRTERRYRSTTRSKPHVDTLLQLSLRYVSRYTDSLRVNGALRSDRNRYSLQSLLQAKHLDDIPAPEPSAPSPEPSSEWQNQRKDYGEWPSLLSLKFPNLRSMGGQVVRLARGIAIAGLEPSLRPGSFVAVEQMRDFPEADGGERREGWAKPLYLFQQGEDFLCGPIEGASTERALVTTTETIRLLPKDMAHLHRVIGVAVPV